MYVKTNYLDTFLNIIYIIQINIAKLGKYLS